METIDDIVREMRYGRIPKHRNDRELLLNYADRINEAWDKEANIKKGHTSYFHSIVLNVSNRKNYISHYAFRTKKDAMEVLNILSGYTGIPITTTDDIDYRVGDKIELIEYPF